MEAKTADDVEPGALMTWRMPESDCEGVARGTVLARRMSCGGVVQMEVLCRVDAGDGWALFAGVRWDPDRNPDGTERVSCSSRAGEESAKNP